MQTRATNRIVAAHLARAAGLALIVAGPTTALAQLGAFPAAAPDSKVSPLPVALELAIQERASGVSANLLRASIMRSMVMSPTCYSPTLTPEQWQTLMDSTQFLPPTMDPTFDPFNDRFYTDSIKWGPNGNANVSAGSAALSNLTYSFPADGTTWGLSPVGQGTGPNTLGASLTTLFGSVDRGREFIRQSLASWRRYGGLTYTEVADSGIAMDQVTTRRTTVGDIRIGAFNYAGGANGVLAYNMFPNNVSFKGGDMAINNAYFTVAGTFPDTANNFRYFRNVVAHEHGHGLGFIHPVPCNSTKLMEPFIQTSTDMVQIDDRRAAGRNYGDRFSGNQTLANARDFGNVSLPVLRSIIQRDLSLNGFWNNGTNPSGADFFRFTINSPANLQIITTPRGGTYQSEQQSSGCNIVAPISYNASAAGNLEFVLLSSDGSSTLLTGAATGAGSSENQTISNLPAGTYVVRVADVNAANNPLGPDPNTIVQIYDLELRFSTSATPVYADPYANAGLNKRVAANTTAQFIGNLNSAPTDTRIATTITRYEWDLDGNGTFETGVSPAASQPQPTFTYVSNGVYNVTLRVRDSNNKTSTDTIAVTVFGATTSITGSALAAARSTVIPFTINGTNLRNVTAASMVTDNNPGVTITGTPVPNALGTQVTGLSFVINSTATLGATTLTVSNTDGTANFPGFLTVNTRSCPADLNGDSQVDNTDFVIFADAYSIFDCADVLMPITCPSDLTADGQVDNADFTIFANAYSEFLCP